MLKIIRCQFVPEFRAKLLSQMYQANKTSISLIHSLRHSSTHCSLSTHTFHGLFFPFKFVLWVFFTLNSFPPAPLMAGCSCFLTRDCPFSANPSKCCSNRPSSTKPPPIDPTNQTSYLCLHIHLMDSYIALTSYKLAGTFIYVSYSFSVSLFYKLSEQCILTPFSLKNVTTGWGPFLPFQLNEKKICPSFFFFFKSPKPEHSLSLSRDGFLFGWCIAAPYKITFLQLF